jgi:NRAMP (natural resistance-associated macrophage protein)-like metal ion transporter
VAKLNRPRRSIQDPLLRWISAGPDREPRQSRVEKGSAREGEPASGNPPAGLTSLAEIRRRGPLGVLRLLGPGLITGASDDDPSGIGTYSQVGSQFGYGMLWTALFTFPLMLAVQELCARIALVTGVGLGAALRRKFPATLVGACIAALLVANTINLGADLGAVAAGGSLLSRGVIPPLWLVVPAALLILVLQLFVSYRVMFNVFKWLTLALFAYVVTGILSRPPALTVLVATFVPHLEFNRDFLLALVAILGTTISPYLFFWQASAEIDAMRAAGHEREAAHRGVKLSELRAARVDIAIGMFFSQVVMYFIILTTATVLHAHGKTDIQTADQAAQALAPFVGPFASVVFAAGMIGTGLLAVPILSASAAYAVKEFFGFKGALGSRPWYRPTFYMLIVVATAVGTVMNFLRIDPVKALFYSAAINGIVAPPLLALIVLLGSDRRHLGERASGGVSRALGWIATAAMAAAAVALLISVILLPRGA